MPADAATTLRIVFGLIGIALVIIGYLVGVKQKLGLIAGYKPEKTKDPAGLARFMGTWTFILGLILIGYPWLPGVLRRDPPAYATLFFLPIAAIIIVMIVGCNYYERKTPK